MGHFIAYHNRAKMGRTLAEGDPLAVVSTRPLAYLHHNRVWFIEGDESPSAKEYFLSSRFNASEYGQASEGSFRYFAKGPGHVFDPPIVLNDFDWFVDLRKKMANFSLGVHRLDDDQILENLLTLARQFGSPVND